MSKLKILDAVTGEPEGQMSNVGHFQIVGQTDAAQMALAIREDIATFERHSRLAAFIAVRVGMRLLWVRDNGEHGDIGVFIKTHLAGIARSTVYNYLKVAESFAVEAKLIDRKTHKLTDGSAVAPILNEQLELFADPEAEFQGALKKVVKWVGDRGLSQIYKDIAEPPPARKHLPPAGGGDNPEKPQSRRQQEEAEAVEQMQATLAYVGGKLWHYLDEEPLTGLSRAMRKAADAMEDLLRERLGRKKK